MVIFSKPGHEVPWQENGTMPKFRLFWVLARLSDFKNAIFGISDVDLVYTKRNKVDISNGTRDTKMSFFTTTAQKSAKTALLAKKTLAPILSSIVENMGKVSENSIFHCASAIRGDQFFQPECVLIRKQIQKLVVKNNYCLTLFFHPVFTFMYL